MSRKKYTSKKEKPIADAMKFKVGDRVKVKSYQDICKIGGEYNSDTKGIPSIHPNNYFFTDEMKRFCEKEYKIRYVFPKTKIYTLSPIGDDYGFAEEWLEKVNNPMTKVNGL